MVLRTAVIRAFDDISAIRDRPGEVQMMKYPLIIALAVQYPAFLNIGNERRKMRIVADHGVYLGGIGVEGRGDHDHGDG